MSMICKNCGTASPDGSRFCVKCGAPFPTSPSFCPSCGAKLEMGTRFCPRCGAPVTGAAPQNVQAAGNIPPAVPMKKSSSLPVILLSVLGAAVLAGLIVLIISMRSPGEPAVSSEETPAAVSEPKVSETVSSSPEPEPESSRAEELPAAAAPETAETPEPGPDLLPYLGVWYATSLDTSTGFSQPVSGNLQGVRIQLLNASGKDCAYVEYFTSYGPSVHLTLRNDALLPVEPAGADAFTVTYDGTDDADKRYKGTLNFSINAAEKLFLEGSGSVPFRNMPLSPEWEWLNGQYEKYREDLSTTYDMALGVERTISALECESMLRSGFYDVHYLEGRTDWASHLRFEPGTLQVVSVSGTEYRGGGFTLTFYLPPNSGQQTVHGNTGDFYSMTYNGKSYVKPSESYTPSVGSGTSSGYYILPQSNIRKLTYDDIASLSSHDRMLARNEIYARHGRKFNDSEIREYFNSQSWYRGTIEPADFSDSVFSSVEIYNIQFLKDNENAVSAPAGSGYILPMSSQRKLTLSDIAYLSSHDLMLARNEIYARHGRKFNDSEIREYFNSQSWYYGTIEPADFSESLLSDIEKYNIEFIKKHE